MSVENTAGKSENFELVAAIQGAQLAGLELETAGCVTWSPTKMAQQDSMALWLLNLERFSPPTFRFGRLSLSVLHLF